MELCCFKCLPCTPPVQLKSGNVVAFEHHCHSGNRGSATLLPSQMCMQSLPRPTRASSGPAHDDAMWRCDRPWCPQHALQ